MKKMSSVLPLVATMLAVVVLAGCVRSETKPEPAATPAPAPAVATPPAAEQPAAAAPVTAPADAAAEKPKDHPAH